jgi:hypothetical protein
MFKDIENMPTQEEIDYFNCFSFERMDNSSSWINVGFLCFSLYDNDGYHIWNALSKMSKKFEQHVIDEKWNRYITKGTKKYTKGTLIKFAEIDNKEEYDRIKSLRLNRFLNDDPFIDDDENNRFINQRYLLDRDRQLEDETVVCDTVKKFFQSPEIVSLNIRSPYDTGKTQLIKQVMNKYDPKEFYGYQPELLILLIF